MLVTLEGIATDVRPLQPRNAQSPMLVTPEGIVTDVSLLQPLNAPNSMRVTLEGIVTDVRPLQLENAYAPMLVTGTPPSSDGITSAPFVDKGIALICRFPISAFPRPTV